MKQALWKKLLLATLMMSAAATSMAQEHHHHDTPDSIEAQTRKVYFGMEFKKVFDTQVIYNLESMPTDTPVLIMFFSPECGHCVADAQKLADVVPQYDIPFWMISSHPLKDLKEFGDRYKLEGIKNLVFLKDYGHRIHNWFDFKYVPFFALIDKKGNFIKEFNRLPSPEELKSVISTNDFLEMYMK